MGTWGPGNLDNDYALDELGDRAAQLVTSLIERARRKTSRECDEYDYTTLFVDFEMVFALDAKKLIPGDVLPPPDEVEQLKQDYLRGWDENIDAMKPSPEHKKERRRCIMRTFSRFKRICAREAKRREQQPDWAVIEPPALEELLEGEPVATHEVFGDLRSPSRGAGLCGQQTT